MRRNVIIAGLLLILAGAVVYFFLPRGNWRQVNLSFAGFTNSAAGPTGVISIHNLGPVPVVLRSMELEFVGIAPYAPVSGYTNLMRLEDLRTNLSVAARGRSDFFFPVPSNGRRWIAHLEFAPAGLKTRVGEHLIRRTEPWVQSLPLGVRGVPIHVVSQEFAR